MNTTVNQLWASTPLRVAVGRLRTAPHGKGGGGSWWACWQDSFWLGRWSLSLQPPPLPLAPSRPSRTSVCVGHPREGRDRVWTNSAGRQRRGGAHAVVSESHQSGESGDTGRRRPGGSLPCCGWRAPGQVCASGRDQNSVKRARRKNVPRTLITCVSVGLMFVAPSSCTLY